MRKSIYFFLLALAALVILGGCTGSSRQTENVSHRQRVKQKKRKQERMRRR